MILRIDKLPIELPQPKNPSPNAAAAVQELLGGRFGEMSTLMNYTAAHWLDRARHRPHVHAVSRGRGRPQQLSLHCQRPDGVAGRLAGQSVEWQLCVFQRQSQAGSATQLLPGVRRTRQQDSRLSTTHG